MKPIRTYSQMTETDRSDLLGQVTSQRERVSARLASVEHVVAVVSGKGGVGKSLVSAGLAAGLARAGRGVGLLDADLHGPTAARMLGVRASGWSYARTRSSRRRGLRRARDVERPAAGGRGAARLARAGPRALRLARHARRRHAARVPGRRAVGHARRAARGHAARQRAARHARRAGAGPRRGRGRDDPVRGVLPRRAACRGSRAHARAFRCSGSSRTWPATAAAAAARTGRSSRATPASGWRATRGRRFSPASRSTRRCSRGGPGRRRRRRRGARPRGRGALAALARPAPPPGARA